MTGGDACERHEPLGTSVELPIWCHAKRKMGCVVIRGGGACERHRWGLRWSSHVGGHEACEGCAE
eukprot:3749754-Pyramimonas_sp.AAC.1